MKKIQKKLKFELEVCDSLVLKIPKNNFQSICTRYYRCWYIFYIFFCQTSWSLTLTILRMERVIRQRGYICAIVHYNGHSMEVHLYIPNNVAKFSFNISIWKEHFSLCAEMMFFCVRRVQTNTVKNSSSPIFKKLYCIWVKNCTTISELRRLFFRPVHAHVMRKI
jgi:hypothetical protein